MIRNFFKKSFSERDFWTWFEKHSEEYFHLDENNYERLFNKLDLQLSKINGDLVFEFSADIQNGRREFIISADGLASAFPDVIRLTESAPQLAQFHIIAFRQRKDEEHEIRYNEVNLKTEDIFFTYERDERTIQLDLIIYIKEYIEENDDFIGAAFIMIDSLIGEYDAGTKLGEIEFKAYRGEKEAKPIMALPELIDSL
ncbi:hypothetical protein F9802_12885 [Bacillus aerolatus]|uniref:DUF695 domain-containing protein n=1 Tax=Bacillus aerolatus TaxID=2653354 RepID=A0A6I1FP35_9BACI|nr:hypothetical protein [Bacillus aerolatus]KAB7705955.1 hypothetical protein F9802_12885 [Bacillus aerolatus]